MAWWAGVGWGSRIANVESRLTKKGDRDVSCKTKGANCQGGSRLRVFRPGPPSCSGLGCGGEGGSGSEGQDGLWFGRARHTWKSPGRERMGARTRKENQMGKWATGDGQKPPRTQIQINFSHKERRLSQTGLSRLHQAALLHSAGAERGKTRRGTPKEPLCPPNSHGLGPSGLGTVGPRGGQQGEGRGPTRKPPTGQGCARS